MVEHHALPPPAVEALFAVAAARPSREEDLRLARGLLWIGGVLSLAAAAVFFVAANWQALGTAGRFAILHALLVVAVGLALWRPPRERIGRLAMLGAFVLTGALLALFGQTYQTGADVHELFFAWAGLGLAFVVAGQWAVAWGAWALVLNVAFALVCGWLPQGHVLLTLLLGFGLGGPLLFVGPLAANLGLWAACEASAPTRLRHVVAPWLGRVPLTFAFAFGTWGAIVAIAGPLWDASGRHDGGGILLAALALASAGVGAWALRRRRDVFPLAAIAASVIAVGTAGLVRGLDRARPAAVLFTLAAWVVASSTASAWLLMGRMRRWREDGVAE